jgi:hypothetical protein
MQGGEPQRVARLRATAVCLPACLLVALAAPPFDSATIAAIACL